jgi:hypothetical protein
MGFPSAGQLASQVGAIRAGTKGTFVFSDLPANHQRDAVNVKPELVDIWTTTVSGAADSTDYSVILTEADGTVTTVTYTSGLGATIALIAAGLAAAWNAEPKTRRYAVATATATTAVFTGLLPGQTFTVTDSSGSLSEVHTQTGASAEVVYFGRFVFTDGYSAGKNAKGFNAKTSYFTAQVATGDYTYNNTSVLGVRVKNLHTGIEYTAQVTQGTSKDASTTALAGAINALLPANTVVATNGGAGPGYTLILTAEVAGLEFSAELFTSEAATCNPTTTLTTGPTEATSILRAALGVTLLDTSEIPDSLTATEGYYPANSIMQVADSGYVWVDNSQSVGLGDTVYVEMDGTGANYGKLYNSSSATRLALPLSWARWERYAGSQAVVNLSIHSA